MNEFNITQMDSIESLLNSNDKNTQEIMELFNGYLQKKNLIRKAKLSDVQDGLVNQMQERVAFRADSFSNDDIIKWTKSVNDMLSKSDDDLKAPSIQINQQVNVDKLNLNSDSRKKILDTVNKILNGDTKLEELIDTGTTESTCD